MNGHDLGQVPLPNTTSQARNLKQTLQAAKLQRFAFDAALALQTELSKDGVLRVTRDDAMALAQLVRSWDVAANRLRVLRGRGLPAAVKSARMKSPAQIEPLDPS